MTLQQRIDGAAEEIRASMVDFARRYAVWSRGVRAGTAEFMDAPIPDDFRVILEKWFGEEANDSLIGKIVIDPTLPEGTMMVVSGKSKVTATGLKTEQEADHV